MVPIIASQNPKLMHLHEQRNVYFHRYTFDNFMIIPRQVVT